MKRKIGLFIVFVLLMIGCSEKEIPQDKFYANAGEWDTAKFPLVKPFYMFCWDGQNWMVVEDGYNGYKCNYGSTIYEVKRLKVFENLFLFWSYGDDWGNSINGENHSESWFIIDMENKIKEGYPDYKSFSDTLYSQYQITVDTSSWREPKSYYEEFKKEHFMPWFPDSISNNRIRVKKDFLDWIKSW